MAGKDYSMVEGVVVAEHQPLASSAYRAPVERGGTKKPWLKDRLAGEQQGADDELDFDGPNPFGERALDIYGQAVGQIESGNRYEITGGYNNHYQGRYQMGRDALADVGVGFTTADREAFLADPDAQDAAFRAFTLQNHATLSRLSRRYREMSRTEQLGILGYAHNQGAGGALDYLRAGTAGRDGFGTNPEVYISAVRNGLSVGKTQEGDTDAS